MPESYSERCGARWGQSYLASWNSSWPFAKVNVTRYFIELGGLLMEGFFLQREDIEEIKIYQGFMASGIRILHSRKDYPVFILIWPISTKRMKRKLEEFGYSVKE